MTKPFIVANVRDITDLWDKEEISYSRMVEMLNEKAAEFYKQEVSKEREEHLKKVESVMKMFDNAANEKIRQMEKSKKLQNELLAALDLIENMAFNIKQSLTEYHQVNELTINDSKDGSPGSDKE
jgi:hypothetical protein